jgi:hypothetical protein
MLSYFKKYFTRTYNKIENIKNTLILAEKNVNIKKYSAALQHFEKISTELSVLADKSQEIYSFINKMLSVNISNNNSNNNKIANNVQLKDDLQITVNPGFIEIIIPEAIPIRNKFTAILKQQWKEYIEKAIVSTKGKGPLPYFENAVISIEIMNNNNSAWDIDNTAIFFVMRTILNVLKGICIKDDNYKCVRLNISGSYSSVPKTRITIEKVK